MGYDETIKVQDETKININDYERLNCGCIVVTHDNKILLQHRPENWRTFPGCLATFGGGVDVGETPKEALVRELKEELGAKVDGNSLQFLGVVTESYTNHKELIYSYFWQDKKNTITGCYECEPRYYKNIKEASEHPKIMDDVSWMLNESKKRGLVE